MGDINQLVYNTSQQGNALIQQSMSAFGTPSVDKHDVSQSLFNSIDWDQYVRAGLIEDTEMQLLRRAQDSLEFATGGHDRRDARALAGVLMKIARNVTSNNVVQQYAFTRMEEMLGMNPTEQLMSDHPELRKRAKVFLDGHSFDTTVFMQALRNGDNFTKKAASIAFAAMLTVSHEDFDPFVAWICDQLSATRSSADPNVQAALPALCVLLRNHTARDTFSAHGGVGCIAGLLSRLGSSANAQVAYECCFVLWILSLDNTKPQQLFLTTGAVRGLIEQLAAAPSRKVVRMALAALHNLAVNQNHDILTEMLTGNLDKHLSNMMHANAHLQANDPDVEADCKHLYEILMRNYRDLSTYERWKAEVNSGLLRDGILHTEKFWKENARFAEEEDFRMIRLLVQLLDSHDEHIQVLALNDIGEFARFYPNGRIILKAIGAKDKVMTMLSQGSDELKSKALQTMSKLMITNWEFVR